MANDSSDPWPIAIPPVDRDRAIVSAQATAARPPRHRLRLGPLEQGPCSGRRRLTCPRLGRMSNTCDRSARPPLGRRLFRGPPTSTPVPFCSCNQPYPPPVLQG